MNAYKYLLFLVLITGFSFADNINDTLIAMCSIFYSVLPVGLLLLIVLAAVVYAIGQVTGAETRARATVWATSMMTGALVAAIIFIVIPSVLETLGISEIAAAKEACSPGVSAGGGSVTQPSICAPGYVYVNDNCVVKVCSPPCKPNELCSNGMCIPKLAIPK